jgi:hypothetical protein
VSASHFLFTPQTASEPRPLPGLGLAPAAGQERSLRRDHIWELSPNLHCSIVGTCLTTTALRQLLARLGQLDAKTASDHDIHSRAVHIAGQHDVAGKMLNRMLEKRHEAHIRRFAKAKTAAEVQAMWREALGRGEIPGAYWAALTHTATDQAVVAEVFGEVHMLSHLVGTSNRADLVRVRELERGFAERDDKIARQESRLQRLGRERDALSRRVEELEQELRRRAALTPVTEAEGPNATLMKQRLESEQARSAQLTARIAEQDQTLSERDERIKALEGQDAALRQELASLETTLANVAGLPEETTQAAPDLAGKRLLYVGGRPKQLDQMRALVDRLGGTLITHDGGVEESATLLPGLVGQADLAFFPVDCVSHRAAGLVKRFCREAGKPFMPLRNASVASFVATLGSLDRIVEADQAPS